MSEETNGAAQPQAAAQVKMNVLAQFVRDMSFENVLAQKGLQSADVQPEIQVQVSLDARKRQVEHQYEVITKFKVTSTNKVGNAPLYLLELDYGGIFHIEGVPDEQLHPFLFIECPRLLFPFARQIIADSTRNGGFPPLMIDPIDFAQMFQQRMAEEQAKAKVAQPS